MRLQLPDMQAELAHLLAQVPRGCVTTYGSLAAALGDSVASRWVGHFMLHHDHQSGCPCHRVVRATGELGGYCSGDTADKERLLADEGINVAGDTVDPKRHRHDRFQSKRPLARLARLQKRLVEKRSLTTRVRRPRLVGGVDVSYIPKRNEGVAAYALIEVASGELLWSTTVRRRIAFPYITSYLAFRELPILLDLMDEVRRAGKPAQVLLVDGSGMLHPRGAGIATQLGIMADVPAVGVTKKLLCGRVDDTAGDWIKLDEDCEQSIPTVHPVVSAGRRIGAAVLPRPTTKRPLFISPGHQIGLVPSVRLVVRLLRGRRLPEPIYWADRISRKEATDV